MKVNELKRYIVILLLFGVQGLWAQVQFEAKASKTSLALNERLRIDFTMNEDGDNFVPPTFEGFRVIAGPSQQVSHSWINGRSSFSKTYSYFLLPLRRGPLVIKQASIEINGQVYKTLPVRITVTAPVNDPRDIDDNRQNASSEPGLELVAEVSKTTPYINEPITVVYKLYFSNNVGITNFRELDNPKYNDFWSQNIEIKNPQAEQTRFNGEPYRMAVLKKVVLYPQKSGKLQIEPLALDVDIEMMTGRRTIWGPQIVQANKRVSAGAKTITVKPLPETGKPADFSGAVGKFDFKVTPSKTNLKSGESLELVVSVSGKGNLKLFDLPKPVVPATLEMYDPVHKENVSTPLSGMAGRVSDTYTIIPQFKGKYPIKPLSFTYFDLPTGKYKTVTSPEITVNVLDGPMSDDAAAAAQHATPEKMKIAANEQFKFIDLNASFQPINTKAFFGSGAFYALVAVPFLLIPVVVMARRRKEAIDSDVVGNRIRTSNRLAKQYLSEAKTQMTDKARFYVALEKALHNFLKAKLHIETSEMSKDKIREILQSRGVSNDLAGDFLELVENCERARYAPSSDTVIQQDYGKAVSLVSDLEKQIQAR
jgi:hypothetical protein